ncbi:mechanosensitive ion channel family protein [Agromyces atrinae]|uniref:mechanosensitive ion channel family protein n=1 Tax=Agromyces atrinae TaxID=592376 RepID=UPI001F590C82|nr:mechanosensitive ion channel family protein [Agromyces atrinae]MCI2956623.1 mechanosensitive ion channel family protein [Agromyces atrinae]
MDGSTLENLLGDSSITGWDLLIAALVIVAGWVLSIVTKKAVLALLRKAPGFSDAAAILIARIAKYAVVLLGFGVGLSFLGASVQPLLAIAIIVAVIAVLALRGIADNFAAGVVLQSRRPIGVGDEIEVDGYVGRVKELTGRTVVLHTLDGRTLHVPNSMLTQNVIVNHSEAGARRSEIEVRVLGAADLDALERDLTSVVGGIDGVHSREPVRVIVTTASPERATLRVQFWHHPLHAVPVRSAAVAALSTALAESGRAATITSDLPDAPLTKPLEP